VLLVVAALAVGLAIGLVVWPRVARGGLGAGEVIATGLVNPRGLAFAPDGTLYIAEAGRYGPQRVRAGEGHVSYRIGRTARVLRVDSSGHLDVVVDHLPSVHWGDDTYGVAGLAFIGQTLYLLLGTGGRDVGDPAYDNAVLRVTPDGQTELVADLTRYNLEQPPLARRLDPEHTDVEGGVPFGFTALQGQLYATDGNQETVTEISPVGTLRRLLEYPASNHVLTGIAPGPDGALYVCEFGPAPHKPGSAKITRLTLDGQHSDAWTGLQSAIGVAFDRAGAMYALEFSSGLRVPKTGRLLRRRPDGSVEVLASGLNFPTALVLGPDGNLYLAVSGHRSEDGSGEIVRVSLGPAGLLDRLRALVSL
jgi:hypothetical protein